MPVSPGPLRRLRDRARARRDGNRDGLLGIPTRDEAVHPPAPLLQVAQRADEVLAELARSCIGSDAADRFLTVEHFWLAFLAWAGADLPPSRYGAALVRFP